ncbi:MAG TPA: hypothetical protein VFI13_04830 [Gemmatimonadales bacterium]|nr:hypothetical protein [Gemmatimonadales bacterium]
MRRLLANWPLKLTSVLLAILLWVVASLEEPVGRRVAARVNLTPPVDRVLMGVPALAEVQLVAPAREFLKLGARPVLLAKNVTDSAEGEASIAFTPADVILPRGITARVVDVAPEKVEFRIVPRGGAQMVTRTWPAIPVAVPGPVERRWLPAPDTVTVTLRGPASRLAALPVESLLVVAIPDTLAGAAALRVIVPAGVTGEAHPAAIRLQPRH